MQTRYKDVIIIRASSKLRLWIPKPVRCGERRLEHREEAEQFYRELRRSEM